MCINFPIWVEMVSRVMSKIVAENRVEEPVHTSDLDRSEIDPEPYRSKCAHSKMSLDRFEIDLGPCWTILDY